MPKFVIERELAGAGGLTEEDLREISQKSNKVICDLGPEIHWLHSYVTDDKIYCVYVAPDLFVLDDDGELSYRREAESEYVSAELPPDAQERAALAAELCPMQAIRLIG